MSTGIARWITASRLAVLGALAAPTGAAGCISDDGGSPIGQDAAVTFDVVQPPFDAPAPTDVTVPPPGDAGPDATVPPSDDGSTPPPPVDAADAADGGVDAGPLPSRVRFGWFVQYLGGLGPPNGYDVCVSPKGTGAWQGPLLAAAGALNGLTPFTMTRYFSLAAGQYDVLLVAAGAACAVPDAGADAGDSTGFAPIELTTLPPLPPGLTVTVGIVPGASSGTYDLAAFNDETSAATGKAKARFVDVASDVGGDTSFGLGGGAAFAPLFAVSAGQRLDPTADPNGYRDIDPIAAIDTSVVTTTSFNAQSLSTGALAIPAGTVLSVFEAERENDGFLPVLLACIDGQNDAQNPAFSSCVATSSSPSAAQANTRFANLLADTNAPSADICIRYHGLTAFAGPLLNGAVGVDAGADGGSDAGPPLALVPPGGGSAAAPLSGYFNVHSGFSYDVRLVAPGSASCANQLVPDGLYTPPLDSGGGPANATLAATGFLVVPNDAGEPGQFDAGTTGFDGGPVSAGLSTVSLQYVAYVDENLLGATAARVIHLAPAYPQPLTVSASTLWGFKGIVYGAFGTSAPGVDPNGYLGVNLPDSFASLTVSDTIGGNGDTGVSYTMSVNEVDTFFLTSYTSDGVTRMVVLQCLDSTYTVGGLWPCNVLPGD